MAELVHTTAELVHSLCCAITACKELNQVLILLQLAVDKLLDFKLDDVNYSELEDADEIVDNIHRLAEITNVSAKDIHTVLFYSSFQELAEVLLSVVAPDWLDRFPDEPTRQRLFYRWFNASPSPALLRCLSCHLSSVEHLPGGHHGSSPSSPPSRGSLVLPMSAHIAADMLKQRFVTTNTRKKEENGTSSVDKAIQNVLKQGLQTPAAAEEFAGLLASIPDRVVLLPQSTCPALQPDVFIPFLTHQLVECVENQGGRKYAPMAAEVLCRVIQRGHTRLVASAVAAALVFSAETQQLNGGVGASNDDISKGDAVALIITQFPASSALEKLLETLLRVLPLQQQQDASVVGKNTKFDNADEEEEEEEQKKKSISSITCIKCLITLLPVHLWHQHSDIRLLFQDKLLTQKVLPSMSLSLLLAYLNSLTTIKNITTPSTSGDGTSTTTTADEDVLAAATWKVATQWGEKFSVLRLPLPQQAYMTSALVQSLQLLGKQRFESYSGLLPALLRGISTRLDSPREPIRRQAMRVGKVVSQILDSTAPPLFGDETIDMLPEEQWEIGVVERGRDDGEGGSKEKKKAKGMKSGKNHKKSKKSIDKRKDKTDSATSDPATMIVDEDYPMTETDSDDDFSDFSSTISSTDSEFERYDLEESDDEDVSKTNLQLRDIISLIQKSESDWKGHLRALRSAESLIRAAPDELIHYSVPLARALLLTTAPTWADEELPPGEDPLEDQRFRSLVALTAAVPEPVGLSLAAEVYSPSLDVQQKSRALAVMAAAAQELSSPGSILKPLEGPASATDTNKELSTSTQRYLQGEKVPGKAGRVVRASERSLAATKKNSASASASSSSGFKANRFPPIALKWAAALLKECDVRRHGVDLFGRDYFILGRLLATLGSFLEASQQAPEAAPLAATVIELIKGKNVHDNEEPYVRRAALMAASHACMAVPPGAIATSLLPSSITVGRSVAARSPSSLSSSTALVERLEWLREWAEELAEHDPDNSCRMMAAACRGLQGALSAEAMASLASSVAQEQEDFLLGGGGGGVNRVILPSFSGGSGGMPSVNVNLPRVETLNLK